MSENTLNAALRRMGYSGDEMIAQGFRADFSKTGFVRRSQILDPNDLISVGSKPEMTKHDTGRLDTRLKIMGAGFAQRQT